MLKLRRIGAIIANNRMKTSTANIYTAGDFSDMPQFVYVVAAARSRVGINMKGCDSKLDLSTYIVIRILVAIQTYSRSCKFIFRGLATK
jgi:pyruvate/2-oxoglutarate dehydrogenase complex dihydrolipoamide dehydrogenase (E3) component